MNRSWGKTQIRFTSLIPFMFLMWLLLEGVSAGQQKPAPPPKAPTVIVLDVAGDGITLTSVDNGVEFALDAPGQLQKTGWTRPDSDDSFLAVDLNNNGVIDDVRELVGTRLVLEGNGPVGLGVNALMFSLQGHPIGPDSKPVGGVPRPMPFGFGELDQSDPGFTRLRLWTDRNHDGKTGPGELKTLAESKVDRISLTFRTYGSVEAAPKDEFGNRRVILGSYKRYKDGLLSPYEMVEVALAK